MSRSRRLSAADLRRAMPADKAREELYGEWGVALVYRPLSYLLTPPLLALGVRANQVTLTSALLVLALPFVAALTAQPWSVGGVVALAVAFHVLDCVDGNIARATGSSGPFGHYLDFVVDVAFRVGFYLAAGFLAAAAPLSAPLPLAAPATALLAAVLAIMARLSRIYSEARFGGGETHAPAAADEGVVRRWLFPFLSGLDSMLPLLLLGAWLVGHAATFLLVLLAYTALDFAYSQWTILHRLR